MRYARIPLAALVVLFLFTGSAWAQKKKQKLPDAAETIYLPTDPPLIRYHPENYEGRNLRVLDEYGEVPNPDRLSRTAIREGWDPAVYHIFDTSHQASEMRCYVRLSDSRVVDVAKGLAEGERITLYGKLKQVEARKEGRMLRFEVHYIERGHNPRTVLTMEFASDKHERKLYRIWEPRQYEVVYPPAKNQQEEKQNAFWIDVAFKADQVPPQKQVPGKPAPKVYAPVASALVASETKRYVGKNLLLNDAFDSLEDRFPKAARDLGFKTSTHLLFRTPATGKSSDLYCYVPRAESFYCDLVEALVQNVKITLRGTLVAYDEHTLMRAKHFLVDQVDVGWEEKPAVEIKFAPDKTKGPWKGYRFYKPYMYLIPFPPWAQQEAFTLKLRCIY